MKEKYLLPFASLIILIACQQRDNKLERPQSLKQDQFVQVYFNQNQAKGADYTEPYRQINRPGDNLEKIIIEAINNAQYTIDVAVQEFRLPKIAQALAERHREGVKVRVIIENSYNRPFSELSQTDVDQFDERDRNSYAEFVALVDTNKDGKLDNQEINQGDALVILRNAGIALIDDTADGSKGTGLMHHKFVIVDGSKLIVTSANFTTSDQHGDFLKPESRGNANNLLTINNNQLAKLFTEEFNLMWGDGPGGQFDSKFGVNKPLRKPQQINLGEIAITVQFSPISPAVSWNLSSNGLIGKVLNNATSSVNVALFVFSEQNLANILENRHQQELEIKALIDPQFAFRNYSEGLDLMGVALSNKCKYETNNSPWTVPINTVGVPQLPEGDKLHHKFGIVDREIVITGSHNWSAAANNLNDETLLVIKSPTVAAHFTQEFEQLYSKAVLGVPISLQKQIEEDRQNCPQLNTVLSPSSSQSSSSKLININTASQTELESLPGIGPELAERIIEARQQKPFTSLEDLDRVSGIGSAKLKKLQSRVTW